MDATQEPTSSMLDMFRFVFGKVLKKPLATYFKRGRVNHHYAVTIRGATN